MAVMGSELMACGIEAWGTGPDVGVGGDGVWAWGALSDAVAFVPGIGAGVFELGMAMSAAGAAMSERTATMFWRGAGLPERVVEVSGWAAVQSK